VGHYPKIKIFFIILIQYNDLESIFDINITNNNEAIANRSQFFAKFEKMLKINGTYKKSGIHIEIKEFYSPCIDKQIYVK
jgi:hypothetical protein